MNNTEKIKQEYKGNYRDVQKIGIFWLETPPVTAPSTCPILTLCGSSHRIGIKAAAASPKPRKSLFLVALDLLSLAGGSSAPGGPGLFPWRGSFVPTPLCSPGAPGGQGSWDRAGRQIQHPGKLCWEVGTAQPLLQGWGTQPRRVPRQGNSSGGEIQGAAPPSPGEAGEGDSAQGESLEMGRDPHPGLDLSQSPHLHLKNPRMEQFLHILGTSSHLGRIPGKDRARSTPGYGRGPFSRDWINLEVLPPRTIP